MLVGKSNIARAVKVKLLFCLVDKARSAIQAIRHAGGENEPPAQTKTTTQRKPLPSQETD
jgi:hypothetical protein